MRLNTRSIWLGSRPDNHAQTLFRQKTSNISANVSKEATQALEIENPHARDAGEVLDCLNSSPEGLSEQEALNRLEAVGRNRLPEPEKEGVLKRFFKHFNDQLIYILIAAALVTAALGHWVDTGVILGVVVINAVIGFIQEGKAGRALEGIRRMLSLRAKVRRDGEWMEIDADDLVPGDFVRLQSGDRVPADLRLTETVNLQMEESALTGEAEATDKVSDRVEAGAGVGDRHSMAHSGTMVASGRGKGVVTATGIKTELGRITEMISSVETLATPLTRKMNQFGKVLSLVIVGMAGLMFLAGWFFHDYTFPELFLAAIGFSVAAIPEGLPAILSITLALGVQRMAGRNAITRKLNAVETLGSVTVICSDKTGTLTRNEMTVRRVLTRAAAYDVSGTGYHPEGAITAENDGRKVTLDDRGDLHALVEVMALCNDSGITEKDGQWKPNGEPTEAALRTLARKAGFGEGNHARLAEIPFESENKFMATLNRLPQGGNRILLKGAPDRLLDRCTQQRGEDGSIEDLDRAFWEKAIDRLSGEGLRLLAAASRDVEEAKSGLSVDDLEENMIFLGLTGIMDPPRPEAIEAVNICRDAGIRVTMITGDHAGTAGAIGREMGIVRDDDGEVVTGSELDDASEEQFARLARERNIFARTSPGNKLRLVKALQSSGEVVAMTGDGVNDAPALKRADVGIAMGIKGTEATKEAAEIVLADDNFLSIERAVEEGRTIYDNLRKAILFLLPTNGAEALVMLTAVMFGLVLPLTPVQILWVNMVTAVTLALALAFEPPEQDVMRRPPRDPEAPILGGAFLWRISFVSVLIGGATIGVFFLEKRLGMSLEVSRTLAVNTLVCGQAFYLFNSRFMSQSSLAGGRLFTNRAAWIAVGVLAAFQLVFVYTPFMQTLFGSSALGPRHWILPLGTGLAVFLIVEGEKFVVRRFFSRGPGNG